MYDSSTMTCTENNLDNGSAESPKTPERPAYHPELHKGEDFSIVAIMAKNFQVHANELAREALRRMELDGEQVEPPQGN